MLGAVSALDSVAAGAIHTTDELRAVLGEAGMFQRLLQVEAALAQVQADADLVPSAAATLLGRVSVDDLDLVRLGERTADVGYPVVGLVEQLAAIVPDGFGEYAHWGATTQDIMDTALVLQIRDALQLIEVDLVALAWRLHDLAEANLSTPMVGRSQGQQALPITFGYRAAGWLAPLLRHLERLTQLRPRVEVVQFGGAVGTLASLAPNGLTVRAGLAARLGLADPAISWHSARDRIVEVVAWAAQVAGSLAKIGLDVALGAQTEIGELVESSGVGRGVSSTMPQKRNPVLSQQLIRAARLTRTHLDLALDSAVADNDRATAAWSLEWNAVAPALAVAGGAVAAGVDLVGGLSVNTDAMAANLDLTDGLIMAEAVMMQLAPQLGRQEAHDLVAALAERSLETGQPFAAVVSHEAPAGSEVPGPGDYSGHAADQVRAVLAEAARVLPPLDPARHPPDPTARQTTRSPKKESHR